MNEAFRSSYLDFAQLTAQLRRWQQAHPGFVRLESIGTSAEGRELWVLTLGPDPDRVRPAVWVDGNMHASELCGSSVALAIAEDVIRLHAEPAAELHGLPAHVRDRLREVLFHVMPRMSPDGAEALLKTGRYVRSVPRDERPNRNHARWLSRDVDGDGLALVMRQQDQGGEFVESSELPGLLVERTLEDPGPYYKVYPEGVIEHFDGVTIPSPWFLSDNQTDLNRNFPFQWYPEHEQVGAGSYPLNEPESRAVVDFTSRRPHLFAWLNLHTFGGVFIRPPGDKPDSKMDEEDLALYRQLAQWGEACTGYPMVSGYEEFTYQPEKPIRGDLTDYAYHQRGCLAYVCELWDLFEQAGLAKQKRFVDRYTHLDRADMLRIARWDAEHNAARALRPWQRFDHPQLGALEVGGLDPRVGLWNPPYERIDGICRGQSAMFLRVAALAPDVRVAELRCMPAGGELHRIEARIENRGYLATHGLASARKLAWNEELLAELATTDCVLDNPREARQKVGHLDGWGRGRFSGEGALYHLRSRGNTGARTLSWTVRGRGRAALRVGSCRTGWITRSIEVSRPR